MMGLITETRQWGGLALASLVLAACGGDGAQTPAPEAAAPAPSSEPPAPAAVFADVNAGSYELEKTHASLVWRISHNGLSNYTARFTDFDATLMFDPSVPSASTLSVTINPLSVRTDHPNGPDWDTELGTSDKFFHASAHPQITFVSTDITPTGDTTGLITGDLTLLGVTQNVTLEARFNGVTNQPWYGERDVIGFSATAMINRSDFGMKALLPDIGDTVTITIEAEFLETE